MKLVTSPFYSTFERCLLAVHRPLAPHQLQQHHQVKTSVSNLFIPRPKIVNEQPLLIQTQEYVPLTIQSCLYLIVLEGL